MWQTKRSPSRSFHKHVASHDILRQVSIAAYNLVADSTRLSRLASLRRCHALAESLIEPFSLTANRWSRCNTMAYEDGGVVAKATYLYREKVRQQSPGAPRRRRTLGPTPKGASDANGVRQYEWLHSTDNVRHVECRFVIPVASSHADESSIQCFHFASGGEASTGVALKKVA
jgi:hypothetical protein